MIVSERNSDKASMEQTEWVKRGAQGGLKEPDYAGLCRPW